MTARAKKGGELGANGEFYEGGKFINTVAHNPKTEGSKPKRVSKVEIEPYVWVLNTEHRTSIYRILAGIFGKVINGVMVINTNAQVLNYTGRTLAEVTELANRYNMGERWL